MVMFSQGIIRSCFYKLEGLLVRLHVLRKKESRKEKMEQFLSGYQNTVTFLRSHKKLIAITIVATIVQRYSVFTFFFHSLASRRIISIVFS